MILPYLSESTTKQDFDQSTGLNLFWNVPPQYEYKMTSISESDIKKGQAAYTPVMLRAAIPHRSPFFS